MSSVQDLKQSVDGFMGSARDIEHSLERFLRTNDALLDEAKSALRGTSDPVSVQVSRALDEARASMKQAISQIDSAIRAANSYTSQL